MDVITLLILLLIVVAIILWASAKKYLGGGLSDKMKKRVEKEIAELRKIADDNKVNISNELQDIDFKLKGRNIHITLPDKYPFSNPTINEFTIDSWDGENKLTEHVKRFAKDHLMLVYCHPRKIDLNYPGTHFQVPNFNVLLNEKGMQNAEVFAVDIEIPERTRGDLKADGFNDQLLERNKEMFDMVWLPDCGGPWYTYQNSLTDKSKFIELIKKVSKIVKPGGTLMLSKFLLFKLEEIVDAIKDDFKEVKIKTFADNQYIQITI